MGAIGHVRVPPSPARRTLARAMILPREPGAHVVAVASALPATVVDREAAVAALATLFPDEDRDTLRGLVERSGVETRHIVPTLAEVLSPSTFTDRNERYRIAALALARRACVDALERARVEPDEIDVVIDVSCTGIAIPALDVELVPRLGLRADVRRIPVTESGCAAGALALGMAATFAQAGQRVLVVAVELCSLTLCSDDRSRTNLVASVIFGDGAAAAVVLPGGRGPRFEALGSHLLADTSDAMGFDVGTHGMRILLRRELPVLLARSLPGVVDGFLNAHGRERSDVGLHLIHPGGRRILDEYARSFDLDDDALRLSREALRRTGNLSSVSILTVVELAMDEGFRLGAGKEALLVGVGPGLSLELALLSGDDG